MVFIARQPAKKREKLKLSHQVDDFHPAEIFGEAFLDVKINWNIFHEARQALPKQI